MTTASVNRVAIIGLGLIGSSLARAIRNAGWAAHVVAYDQDDTATEWAVEHGVIDEAADNLRSAVDHASLVILAVPVGSFESTLSQLLPTLSTDAVLTDVGSSKAGVIKVAKQVLGDRFKRFVPGHPIAGKERSGVRAGTASLFRDHRVILTPSDQCDIDALTMVESLWAAAGAEVKRLSPDQHDRVMAATSHLPHVLAYAAVNTLAQLDDVDEIFEFAAGGFRDFSRIASSDPIMWRDICLSNRDAILSVLDQFEAKLQQLRHAISKSDREQLQDEFARSKRDRDRFLQKFESRTRCSQPESAENALIVAGVPEHFNLPWHLACEQGVFKQAGLSLHFREFPGGTGAMTRAMAAGEVDMAIVLAEGAVADIANRGNAKLVKVYVETPLIWGIHVAAKSDIENISEIRDRRYAISRFGSGSHLMAIVDADERGWKANGLEFEIVKNLSGARSALAGKEADTFFWERFTTQPYVDNGEFRRIGQRKTLWPAFVVSVSNEALENKTAAVKQCLELINQQCQHLMDASDAATLIASRYQLKLEEVQQWMSQTRWSTDFERPDQALSTVIEYLNRLEIIDSPSLVPEDVWQAI